MEKLAGENHWETIYSTKETKACSWYQEIPGTSIDLIKRLNLANDSNIMDAGGGDSFLADHLLGMGFKNLTVLDISAKSLEKSRTRLGKNAVKINWVVADIAGFITAEQYDLWHDRATFHFLTEQKEVDHYTETVARHLKPGGFLILATFSDQGPSACSGLQIRQYSENTMNEQFKKYFEKVKCFTEDHQTPSGSVQNFIYCLFRKKNTDHAISPHPLIFL